MSQTIWKYDLELTAHVQELTMPLRAAVLTVQLQRGKPCLWAAVDGAADRGPRRFAIVGTGQPMDHIAWPAQYIGTFQMADGAFVWHVFEMYSPT